MPPRSTSTKELVEPEWNMLFSSAVPAETGRNRPVCVQAGNKEIGEINMQNYKISQQNVTTVWEGSSSCCYYPPTESMSMM